jgi:hypothetical protein
MQECLPEVRECLTATTHRLHLPLSEVISLLLLTRSNNPGASTAHGDVGG